MAKGKLGPMSLLSTIQELRDFDTALLANTVGYVDDTPVHEWYMGGSIASVTPSLGPTVGVAFTCEVDSSSPGNVADWDPFYRQVEAMEKLGVPAVWVAKCVGSRPDHECVLGDGMAKLLGSVGCQGAVIDGGVRDIEGLLSVPFAAYCRGRTIHHCAVRFPRADIPVQVGGITVNPGDVIHANAGGVIRLPRKGLERLPALASEMRAFEHDAHRVMRQTGVPVAHKRKAVADILARTSFGRPPPG
jgi:4-hydroxy-4-methyl-2-oxoglutarate aldolase